MDICKQKLKNIYQIPYGVTIAKNMDIWKNLVQENCMNETEHTNQAIEKKHVEIIETAPTVMKATEQS